MEYNNIEFTAVVAVGIEGVAILNISESVKEGWSVGEHGKCDCVVNNLHDISEHDWWEYLAPNKSMAPGLYFVKGDAYFTEDDADYSNIDITSLITP